MGGHLILRVNAGAGAAAPQGTLVSSFCVRAAAVFSRMLAAQRARCPGDAAQRSEGREVGTARPVSWGLGAALRGL